MFQGAAAFKKTCGCIEVAYNPCSSKHMSLWLASLNFTVCFCCSIAVAGRRNNLCGKFYSWHFRWTFKFIKALGSVPLGHRGVKQSGQTFELGPSCRPTLIFLKTTIFQMEQRTYSYLSEQVDDCQQRTGCLWVLATPPESKMVAQLCYWSCSPSAEANKVFDFCNGPIEPSPGVSLPIMPHSHDIFGQLEQSCRTSLKG